MKRSFFLSNLLLILALLVYPEFSKAQSSDYLTPDQVLSWIKQIEGTHPGVVSSTILASSPGERPLH
ncbi:MAG: hypothetical protein DRI97_08985, partial [Bacteroidetes bacterium]